LAVTRGVTGWDQLLLTELSVVAEASIGAALGYIRKLRKLVCVAIMMIT